MGFRGHDASPKYAVHPPPSRQCRVQGAIDNVYVMLLLDPGPRQAILLDFSIFYFSIFNHDFLGMARLRALDPRVCSKKTLENKTDLKLLQGTRERLASGSLPYNQLAMHHHPVPWKRAQVRVASRCSRRYKVDRRLRSRFDNVGVPDYGVAPNVELRIAGCRELRFASKSKSIKASCIGSVRSPAVHA